MKGSVGSRQGARASILLGAIVIAAVVSGAGARVSGGATRAEARATLLPPDAYACYVSRFRTSNVRTVRLRNQFASTPALVRNAFRLCSPAKVNRRVIRNRRAHLTCHAVTRTTPLNPLTRQVILTDVFGTLRAVVAGPPESFCLPSSKRLGSGVPPAVPRDLDHYLCYPLDPQQPFKSRRIVVGDQFRSARDTLVAPRTLCLPTSKNDSRLVRPRVHLVCYVLKSAQRGRTISVRTQFAILRGVATRRERLCVPATKRVVPEPPPAPGETPIREATADPQKSGTFEPFPVPGEDEDRNNDPPHFVPTGPARGTLGPSNDATTVQKPGLRGRQARAIASSSAARFFVNTSFRFGGQGSPPDMSGADAGRVVLATGNTYGALSTDGGATFRRIDPTTIFPSAPSRDAAGNLLDNGLCCDQVVQYVPQIDRFIWLMQFCGAGANCLQGRNKLRIASASSAAVAAGATAWTYWDLTSATFGLDGTSTPNMDYPDMAVGTNSLYVSVDNVSNGLLVMRIPLSEIAASTTIHIGYTNPADGGVAYGGHLTQNVGDTAFWAGHLSNTQMRIFSMRDSETVYRWRDVNVNSWCNGTRTSFTPGGTNDWLAFGFPGFAVHGSTQRFNAQARRTELWFSWGAGHTFANGRACGFPQSHVQIVVLDAGRFALLSQMQVWNPTIAFAYDALATNDAGEVGMSLGYGGAADEASHAVGFWGDFLVYSTVGSTSSTNRYGDYLGIRRSWPTTSRFSAEGYGITGGTFDPRYVVFGR